MKKISVAFVLFSLILVGCSSSINLVNKWKAEDPGGLKSKKILVITRTPDTKARATFENELVNQLKENGIDAVASHKQYANYKPNAEHDEERQAKIKSILENDGFGGVVLTVLKDKLKNIKATEEGGYNAGQSMAAYYPPYIPVYSYGFYGGFYSPYYYSSSYWYNTKTYDQYGTYVEKSIETETTYSFVLESLVYNLSYDEKKQLVGYATVKIDEPDNINITAKNYTKTVLESFKN